jgi:branched-chain amino acid transport system ATP-binding protein
VLSVHNLNAWYGKSHVVRDLNLEIADRRVVGILGRNGVGKTTTMKTIIGIMGKRSGQVVLDGREVQSLSADRIARSGIGYVPQGRQLFPYLTVRENLHLAWHGQEFGEAELERSVAHFPPLSKLKDRLAGSLSGGEQQMVAIGRAMLNKPRVILLDEPTEGLSPLYVDTVRQVIDIMRQQGTSVLLVEQNIKLALSVCQYVYFMEKGTIEHQCPTEDARTNDVVERFLGVHIR